MSIFCRYLVAAAAFASVIHAQQGSAVVASNPTAVSTAPGVASPDALSPMGDRFGALHENSQRLKRSFEQLENSSITEIDRLLATRRCQVNRVNGLLDRLIVAQKQYEDAEIDYWTKWGDVEQTRVEGQQKSLASMETDQIRVKQMIETETTDHDALLRKRAQLEKYGKRTEAIISEVDALVSDIRDSETRLAEAQKQYEEITVKVTNMNASIMARLIDIRQSRERVEAWALETRAYYEGKRKDANEICNLKQPDSGRTPLPKRKGN